MNVITLSRNEVTGTVNMHLNGKTYRVRYYIEVARKGKVYNLLSENGCFYDIYLDGKMIGEDYTSRYNAIAAIRNGDFD